MKRTWRKRLVAGSLIWMLCTGIWAPNARVNAENRAALQAAPITDLFHDQGYVYMPRLEPAKGEAVILRMRAVKDSLTGARLEYTLDEGQTFQSVSMTKDGTDDTGYYEYWKGVVPAQQQRYHYRFAAYNSAGAAWCGTFGAKPEAVGVDSMFCVIPGFSTPDWSKGILWYSINTDAFYNGDVLNDLSDSDKRHSLVWGNSVAGLHDFYGGDFQGIREKIQYLKDLGVEAVYLNPIWKSNVNVGYGIANYDEISPAYGNEKTFIALSGALHQNGLRLLLDGVFSYGSSEGKWFNASHLFPLDGAVQSRQSPYYDMFDFTNWPDEYRPAWGNAALNLSSQTARDLIYRNSDSIVQRYLKAPYSADGWRYDAVQYYWGTDTDQHQVAADMKTYVKSAKPEALYMREEFVEDSLYRGIWESSWGNSFLWSTRNWFNGVFDQEGLVGQLNETYRLPRAMGLSIYTHFSQHDFERMFTDTDSQRSKIRAAQILLMTYIGSPCIYYGDEVGVEKDTQKNGAAQYRNAFQWDESAWDYDIYHLQKALGQLRKEHSALRDGVLRVGEVDNDNNITVFGRWNGEDSVVTILSQNACVMQKTLDVRQYNIGDGVLLTDYLSGRQYRVQNGCVSVDIMPGGSILAVGNSGTARGKFTLSGQGGQIVQTDVARYQLTDSGVTAATPVFGNASIHGLFDSARGGGRLFLRDEQGRCYTALQQNGQVTFTVDGESIGQAALPAGAYLRVARQNNGVFSTQYALPNAQGQPGVWRILAGSQAAVAMDTAAQAGFGPAGGVATLSNVQVTLLPPQMRDDFESPASSMLSVKQGQAVAAQGVLTTAPRLQTLLLGQAPQGDFTLQSSVVETAGMAGVAVMTKEGQGVAAVRRQNTLDLGRMTADGFESYASVPDPLPGAPILLQLQKTGGGYSAVYQANGQWHLLGSGLFANFSTVEAGLWAQGESVFDCVAFGDGQNASNTPKTPGDSPSLSFTEWTKVRDGEQTRIVDGGEWEYILGGIRRTQTGGLSQMAVTSKTYGQLRAEATLLVHGGQGAAGFTFGRGQVDNTLGDGYVLRLTAAGQLQLLLGDEVLRESQVSLQPEGVRLILEISGRRLAVYAGQQATLQFTMELEPVWGYFTYFAKDASADFTNYWVYHLNSPWADVLSAYSPAFTESDGAITVTTEKESLLNLQGKGFTDVLVSGWVEVQPVSQENEAYAGFLLGASAGYVPQRQGVLTALSRDGTLRVLKEGREIAGVATGKTRVFLQVAVKDGEYRLYLDGCKDPVLVYQDSALGGGVFSLVSAGSRSRFEKLSLSDLSNTPTPSDHPAFVGEWHVTRNGQALGDPRQIREEGGTGVVRYAFAPNLEPGQAYRFSMNILVEEADNSNLQSPAVFFRGNGNKQVGLVFRGDGAYIVNQSVLGIPGPDGQSSWRNVKRVLGKTHQVELQSEVDNVSVWIDGALVYDRFPLGDYAGLDANPQIWFVQGAGVKAQVGDLDILPLTPEPITPESVLAAGSPYEKTGVSGAQYMDFNTNLSPGNTYYMQADITAYSQSIFWAGTRFIVRSGQAGGKEGQIYVLLRGEGIFILGNYDGEKVLARNYDVKRTLGRTYRLTVKTTPQTVSVWLDGQMIFDRISLRYDEQVDFRIFPPKPRLCFAFGEGGQETRLKVEDFSVWADETDTLYPVFNEEPWICPSPLVMTRDGKRWQGDTWLEETGSQSVTYAFLNHIPNQSWVFTGEVRAETRAALWCAPWLTLLSDGQKTLSLSLRGDGLFLLNERGMSISNLAANWEVKAELTKSYRLTVLLEEQTATVWVNGQKALNRAPLGEYAQLPPSPGVRFVLGDNSVTAGSHLQASRLALGVLPQTVSGDVNGDGYTNVLDLVCMKRQAAGLTHLPDRGFLQGDWDQNALINEMDVQAVKQKILGG